MTRVQIGKPRLISNTRGLFGVLALVIIIGVVLAAPWLTSHDPERLDLAARLLPPAWLPGGSEVHPLGTDPLGRDIWARIIYGGRISLLVGVSTVVVSGILGTVLGLIAGYARGWVDQLISRFVDIQMSFPFLLLAITIVAFLGRDIVNLVLVLAIATWVLYCRLVRIRTIVLRESQFVEAAVVIGCSHPRIVLRHIFPNVVPVLIVVATFQLPMMIVAEAALSFLGLGIPQPTPTWGNVIADGRAYVDIAWWIITFPGLMLAITVVAIGSIGDWLSTALDPRLRGRL